MAHTLFIPLLFSGLVLTALLASWSDWRELRIPNALLVLSALYAILMLSLLGTGLLRGLGFSLTGAVLCGLVLWPAYRLRQVGAGDVKLAMVFGIYLGPLGGILALLNGALVGGMWALWLSWRQGGMLKLLGNLKLMARTAYVTGFRELGWDLDNREAITMPYGVALSAGAVSIVIWQAWRIYAGGA